MLEEKAEFPVKLMARVLEVSRSGFYSCSPTDARKTSGATRATR